MHGTQMTAHFRRTVADLALKHSTFNAAVAALPKPKNLSEELTRNVLISFLRDEYS